MNILFPAGRVVWGSMYKPRTTDFDNKPLVIKTGPDQGKPTQRFEFGVAFPKNGAQHFSQTPWGAQMWQLGHSEFRNGEAQRPDFAWKVTDGDSQIPNKANKRPCDQEGHPGHFIVSFSSTFPPKLTNADGSQQLLEQDAIKCGYWVEVYANLAGNKNQSNPGIYVNHEYVALAGYDQVIQTGIDPRSIGFGGAQLPAGVSATPVGGQFNPAAPQGYAPPAPPGYAPQHPAPTPYGAPPAAPQGYAPPAPPAHQPYQPPVAPQPQYNPGQGYQPPAAQGYAPPPPGAAPQGYAPPAPPAGPAAYAPPPGNYAPPGGPAAYAPPAPPGAAPQGHYAPPAGPAAYGNVVAPVPSFIHGPR